MWHTVKDHKVSINGQNVVAYGIKRIVQLARDDGSLARTNADNYRYFALAMYLSQKDWSRAVQGTPIANQPVNPRDLDLTGSVYHLERKGLAEVSVNVKPRLDMEWVEDVDNLKRRTFLKRSRMPTADSTALDNANISAVALA